MMDCWQQSRPCFPPRCASAGGSHKQRNVMSAIPKREYQEVVTDLTGIWKQEKQEEALLNLAASTRQISEALSLSGAQPDGR